VANFLVDSDAMLPLALAATVRDTRRISNQFLLCMATRLVEQAPPLANDEALLAFFKSAAPDSFWQSGQLVTALFDRVLTPQLQRAAAVAGSLRCCKRIAEQGSAHHSALLERIARAAAQSEKRFADQEEVVCVAREVLAACGQLRTADCIAFARSKPLSVCALSALAYCVSRESPAVLQTHRGDILPLMLPHLTARHPDQRHAALRSVAAFVGPVEHNVFARILEVQCLDFGAENTNTKAISVRIGNVGQWFAHGLIASDFVPAASSALLGCFRVKVC
jgi:hypothetical protein